MMFSVTIGWWLAPALVTIVSYLAAVLACRPARSGYDWYGSSQLVDGIVLLMRLLTATSVSLVAWLIWALLR